MESIVKGDFLKRFISLLIAFILFMTMIFPNLNNLLAESQSAKNYNESGVTDVDMV